MVYRTALHTLRTDSDGNPNVFNVESKDDGRWLNTNNGNPDNHWDPDNAFAFARRNRFISLPRRSARESFVS